MATTPASSQSFIIGTAGHIDHGKTTLVGALTGMDTDRLAEEKRRGISIDLGFAHLALPTGTVIGFVDVPGHERFVKNMLAGAGGIQAVMLVIAADESVKPQTREHFEICRLLGISLGFIVLTKMDLASTEQIAHAQADAARLWPGVPICEVSAKDGRGLPQLVDQLAELAKQIPERDRIGLMRLPIDRSFALKGFGSVVTGTLWSGTLKPGDTVTLHPSERELRVRGLQVHGAAVETAFAGQRTAVNLAGIDYAEIRRGQVLTHVNELEPTRTVDVSLEWLDGDPPSSRTQVIFHWGTSEVVAMLKAQAPGLARLWLREPVMALPGDRFVLRQPSPALTVAGGTVIDAFPPLRLNRLKRVSRLQSFAQADLSKRVELLVLEAREGRTLAELVRMTGVPRERLLAQHGSWTLLSTRLVGSEWLAAQRARVAKSLHDFHRKNPAAEGAPLASVRQGLNAELASAILGGPEFKTRGDLISLAAYQPVVSLKESAALEQMELAFRQAGFQPPGVAELVQAPGSRGLLESLIKSKRLIRISQELIFHADVIAHIRKSLAAHKGRKFSVPEFKDWMQISRKYAIPLLEYLDRERVTRRDGDNRVVL